MNLTDVQHDALRELINIGVGKAAGLMNRMLESYVCLEAPEVRFLSPDQVEEFAVELRDGVHASVRLPFHGLISGFSTVLFPPADATKIVDVLTGTGALSKDMDSLRIGTLNEIGNVLLNAVMGAVANLLDERLEYSIPRYFEGSLSEILQLHSRDSQASLIVARIRFQLEKHCLVGNIVLYLEVGSMKPLTTVLDKFIERSYEQA